MSSTEVKEPQLPQTDDFVSPSKAKVAVRYWLQGRNYHKALEAMEYAGSFHVGTRKDGITPEFHHQISIVMYLRTLPPLLYPEESIIVAFLHDVVEDYAASMMEIGDRFGERVHRAVSRLSKNENGIKKSLPDLFHLVAEDPVASIVKAADRIHNQQTLGSFSPEKQEKYILETREYILPMVKKARRLFPQQEPAYMNAKHYLFSQIQLLEAALGYSATQIGAKAAKLVSKA